MRSRVFLIPCVPELNQIFFVGDFMTILRYMTGESTGFVIALNQLFFHYVFLSSKSTKIGLQTTCKMVNNSKEETIINVFKIVIPAAHPNFLISKIVRKR